MDANAIEKIESLALAAAGANRIDANTPALILGGNVKSLEFLQSGRSRFRGKFETEALSEFAGYVKSHAGGHGFIEAEWLRAIVFHNLGSDTNPGHADWTSTLTLRPTAAYAALLAIENKPLAQKQIVEWIEDWSPQLRAKFGADAEATGIAAALAAIRNLTISEKKDVTHTDKDFGASRSALEEIEAKSLGGIPSHLIFACDPFLGFASREFALRLSVHHGDKPTLTLRIVSKEAVGEDIAREFKTRLLEEIGDAATMIIGSFTP